MHATGIVVQSCNSKAKISSSANLVFRRFRPFNESFKNSKNKDISKIFKFKFLNPLLDAKGVKLGVEIKFGFEIHFSEVRSLEDKDFLNQIFNISKILKSKIILKSNIRAVVGCQRGLSKGVEFNAKTSPFRSSYYTKYGRFIESF